VNAAATRTWGLDTSSARSSKRHVALSICAPPRHALAYSAPRRHVRLVGCRGGRCSWVESASRVPDSGRGFRAPARQRRMTAPIEAPVGDRSVLDCLNLLVVRPVASTYLALQGRAGATNVVLCDPDLAFACDQGGGSLLFWKARGRGRPPPRCRLLHQGLLDRRCGRSLWKCRRHAAPRLTRRQSPLKASRAFSSAIRSSGVCWR
jgi:hypothetical protein